MDPTTLVTFLFRAPTGARTVELLGSWDNFRQPYRMHNDVRRGSGFWSGCFKFHNIIFDGDKSSWTKPRTGGLKQGGTYWYYYRLDDQIEAYDDSREYTTGCPLLPGQTVNIIEVPIEVEERPTRSRSASIDVVETLTSLPITHTLDPGDKFATLDPPPISKVHERCRSDLALNRCGLESSMGADDDTTAPASSTGQPAQTCGYLTAGIPSGRYYANNSFVDDRSSIYSGCSGKSASPSFAQLYVGDVYDIEYPLDDAAPAPIASPAIVKPSSGSRTGMLYSEPERGSDRPLSSLKAGRTAAEYHRFDFGQLPHCTRYNTDDLIEDGLDSSGNYMPISPRGTFSPSSRPKTAHGALEPRPRLFSFPNRFKRTHSAQQLRPSTPKSPLESTKPAEETNDQATSPHQLNDQDSEAKAEPEIDNFDICSPTFTADTVSSSGGVNTPFRLSVSHSFGANNWTNSIGGGETLESVAERLRSLGTLEDSDFPPAILEEDAAVEDSSFFTGYALPGSDAGGAAARSTQSLGKFSSGHASAIGSLSTTIIGSERQDVSFADSVFSELSFLGPSIA